MKYEKEMKKIFVKDGYLEIVIFKWYIYYLRRYENGN